LAFCVHPDGNFLTIGLLSGIQVNWADIVNKANVHAAMFHLRNWNSNVSANHWQETFTRLIRLIDDNKLRLMRADSTYDLMDIKEAVTVVESCKETKGKVFLTSC
jgi:NADPH:quinone reductase-like Zn-dependent oxidoreductase